MRKWPKNVSLARRSDQTISELISKTRIKSAFFWEIHDLPNLKTNNSELIRPTPELITFRLHNFKHGGEQGKREDIYVWCIFNQKKGEHDSISEAEEKSEVAGQGKR